MPGCSPRMTTQRGGMRILSRVLCFSHRSSHTRSAMAQSSRKRFLTKLMLRALPSQKIARPGCIRKRKKRVTIKLTQEQKDAKRALRESACREYALSLGGARSKLIDLARDLKARHPGHNLQFYLEDITQNREVKPERKVNLWNVFLHAELKIINNSKRYHIYMTLLTFYSCRFTRRCSTCEVVQ